MRKNYRVKSEKEFQRVFDNKQSMANRQMVVYKLFKPGQPHFRVGLSVSKKLGNAVTRNRIKRLMRHAIWQVREDIPHEYDYLVIARADIKNKSLKQIEQSILHIMNLLFKQKNTAGGKDETN